MSNEALLNPDFTQDKYDTRKCMRLNLFKGVEPLMVLWGFVSLMQTIVLNQYIYYRVGNGSSKKSDALQEINAHWMLLLSVGSAVATVLTAPLYSAYSDRFGRRRMLLIPGFGVLVKSVLESVMIWRDWSMYSIVAIETVYGATGGYSLAVSLSLGYTADCSRHSNRTLRLALVGVCVAVGALVASLSSGFWIQEAGSYLSPFLGSAAVAGLCLLYPLIVLPSINISGTTQEQAPILWSSWHMLRSLVTVHTGPSWCHIALSVGVLAAYTAYNVAEMAGVDLQTAYLLSYPICINPAQLGLFNAINIIAINLGTGFTSFLLQNCRCIHDLGIAAVCILFGLAFSLQMAFSASPTAAYVATASNLLSFSAFAFLRGFMSKRTKPSQQGALFGSLLVLEIVSGNGGKVLMVYVYQRTLVVMHGFVYIVIGCFSVLAFILALVCIFLHRLAIRLEIPRST